MNKRTQYSREFKLEAVKLLNSGQKPTTELAQELGIQRSALYRWRDEFAEHGEQAFMGPGRRKPALLSDDRSEHKSLQRELEQLREENEILKKAAAFFARELK